MISSWSENDINGAKPSDFGAAVRDLEPRSKLCLGRPFLKKKRFKDNRHFNNCV